MRTALAAALALCTGCVINNHVGSEDGGCCPDGSTSGADASVRDAGSSTDAGPGVDAGSGPDAGACTTCPDGGNMSDGGPFTGPGGWVEVASGTTNDLRSVWADSDTDAWAVGALGAVLHWDGTSWTATPNIMADLYGVWGSDPSNVWAVGANAMLKWDGTFWSGVPGSPPGGQLQGVFGTSAQDVWAVGMSIPCPCTALATHWDGGAWTQASVGTFLPGYQGVSGITSNSLYAPTVGTEVDYWDGTHWAPTVTNVPERLAGGVWDRGTPWVTTVDGGAFDYIGGSWNGGNTGTTADLHAIWRLPGGDVWAVGDQGAMVVNHNGAWSVAPSVTARNLHGLWATPSGQMWAVGDQGTILHYGPIPSVDAGSCNCAPGQICATFIDPQIGGATQSCINDPCAPSPLSCACAQPICTDAGFFFCGIPDAGELQCVTPG